MRGFVCRQAGLTLVEILVAMGIAVIAGVLILQIVVSSMGLSQNQSSQVEGGLNINNTLQQIRFLIKQGTAVANSYTFDSITYTSGSDLLVLKVSAIDNEGSIISDKFDYFVFYLDSNILHAKVFPDPSSSRKYNDTVFSVSVDNLQFKYLNSAAPPVEVAPFEATKVRVSLTIKQNIAQTEANLRND